MQTGADKITIYNRIITVYNTKQQTKTKKTICNRNITQQAKHKSKSGQHFFCRKPTFLTLFAIVYDIVSSTNCPPKQCGHRPAPVVYLHQATFICFGAVENICISGDILLVIFLAKMMWHFSNYCHNICK